MVAPERAGNSAAKQANDSFRVSVPQISLPKGGGAIRGMGETFTANPVTGTGSMSMPIATSPGRSGFGPGLSLSYDSGAGNGPFGFGWSLAIPGITRKTEKGLPTYRDADESDVFILSGAEDLVPVVGDDGVRHADPTSVSGFIIHHYRPRVEGLFARIERWTRVLDGDVHWRSISRDNVLTIYGKTSNSRIADPADLQRVFAWLICETRDDKGNATLHEYKPEDGAGVDLGASHQRNRGSRNDARRSANRYLKRIRYGNRTPLLDETGRRPNDLTDQQILAAGWMFEVVFDYGEHDPVAPTPAPANDWSHRPDAFSSYRSGFEVRTNRLCQRVLMFHHFQDEPGVGNDCLVRSTDFTYSHEDDPQGARNAVYTFLRAVTHRGYRRNGVGYVMRSLPEVEFEYSKPIVTDEVHEIDPDSLDHLPAGAAGGFQWTDVHGEGIPGLLTEQGGAWLYKRNLSALRDAGVELAGLEVVAAKPGLAVEGGRAQFMDLAGDGEPDLVALDDPVPGFYERDAAQGWQPFRPFTSRLHGGTRDPNLRFIDLDGDGHADVLITADDVLIWHPSLGERGFGTARRIPQALDEEEGPRLVFAGGSQSIHVADMSGDGLSDLVRIRNGEVCYWPNLGHGRFGAKVTMDRAPVFDHFEQFDPERLRLADIDGSGTTDILYLHRDGVRLYFNQSGNSWSAPQDLHACPRVDDAVAIDTADLLGNGTACLVWSSPLPGDVRRQMRYVDLMGGVKPHLLVKIVNNLGAETRVTYAPSTRFYLQDQRAGKSWITRLPFPVHVVERVETYDYLSKNRFATRYAYHHGYFDGEEREFRGFGMVEQWDTAEIAALSATSSFPPGSNVDAASHVPPVHTKTWFHTGIWIGRDHVSDFFAGLIDTNDVGEYYREPGLTDDQVRAQLLDDTVLPDGLTIGEERQACRALKGAMLRQEVYALDGTQKAQHPYIVTEQNFRVRCLQRQHGNRHAVFLRHASEALNQHYERNPENPRIAHALTLEVDDYGNVLAEAAVAYGRRQPDMSLSPSDREQQLRTRVTFTEHRFTNSVDPSGAYRAPLPCESRTYEVTGLSLSAGAQRFTPAQVLAARDDAEEIPYEEVSGGSSLQKRLIEHVRILYRPDDLGVAAGSPLALLPLGVVNSLALPGESYKLAFTPGLLVAVYGNRVTDTMLQSEGGFVFSSGQWWIPSGRVFLSPGTEDTAGSELGEARQHFFLPRRYRDPFHTSAVSTESVVSYDANDLLIATTRDALGNQVTAGNDYRVLQPSLMTDPNGNRTALAFDALGMVVGTAVMGKPLPAPVQGDSLEGFEPDLPEQVLFEHLAEPLADPHAILGRATTRTLYDLFAYQRSRDELRPQPAVAYTLARETHDADLQPGQQTRVQHSFSYSDGFGREMQKKLQAEPGPVPQRDANGEIVVGADGQPLLTAEPVSPRWVGSGWTVFNNKGQPVRQYEPFFTDTHRFEFDVRIGVSPILFYDSIGRVVATLHPDHAWEKVVFDPWRQSTWNVGDTVLVTDPRTDADVGAFFSRLTETAFLPTWHTRRASGALGAQEQAAAQKAALHANTPAVAYADSLGRTVLTIAHNRYKYSNTPEAEAPVEEFYETRTVLDIEGNQREVIDPMDRVVMRYEYDMLGARLRQASMEAGERWVLNDVSGKPIRSWDSRGHSFKTEYDARRRPTSRFVTGSNPVQSDPRTLNQQILFEKTEYGEAQPDAAALNLRGRVFRLWDGAGLVTNHGHDFKGNLLSSSRTLAQDYKNIPDWSGAPAIGETYTNSTTYDALNRPITQVTPDSSVTRRVFNEANLLEAIDVNLRGTQVNGQPEWTSFVTNIYYNAKGQRLRIGYGNGAETRYQYDPETFRLTRLYTRRGALFSADCGGDPPPAFAAPEIPPPAQRCGLQNLHYTYDASGNITHIRDNAQQMIYFDGQVVEPHNDYRYDAIGRLIEATGREHRGQLAQPQTSWNDAGRVGLAHPHDGQAMRNYSERYKYDAVGNFERLVHQTADVNWTREHSYDEASLLQAGKVSNRLSRTSVGETEETYAYDAHGSMLVMPHLARMGWDFEDRLQQVDLGGGGTAYYVYDASGQRVRKVIERQNGTRQKEHLYLGGFEVLREYGGSGESIAVQRESLHVADEKQRVAMVDTRTLGNGGSPLELVRYQIGNHLRSSTLELDDVSQLISYEEYHPYGTTSYQAVRDGVEVSAKRYRYTGQERDEESGLHYHSARYYIGWLGTWTQADPIGLGDGVNVYAYVRGNPLRSHDPEGTENVPANDSERTVSLLTDVQLHRKLKGLAPTELRDLANSTSGMFRERVQGTIRRGKLAVAPSEDQMVRIGSTETLSALDLERDGIDKILQAESNADATEADPDAVRRVINFFLKKHQDDPDATMLKTIKLAGRDLTLLRQSAHLPSQSLILRDAQRFFYGINNPHIWSNAKLAGQTHVGYEIKDLALEGDVSFSDEGGKTWSGELLALFSVPVYENAKAITHAIGFPGLLSSTDYPTTPPGGEYWYSAGVNYATRWELYFPENATPPPVLADDLHDEDAAVKYWPPEERYWQSVGQIETHLGW